MPIDTDSLTLCIGTMESALYDISGRNAESAAWVHNQLVRVNTRMDRKDGPETDQDSDIPRHED